MFSEPFLVLGPAFQRDLHVTVVAVPHTRPSKDELANEHLLQPVLACCRRPGVWSHGRDRGNTGMFYRSSLGDTDVVVSGSSTRVFQRLGSLSLARDGCHSLRGGDVGGSSSFRVLFFQPDSGATPIQTQCPPRGRWHALTAGVDPPVGHRPQASPGTTRPGAMSACPAPSSPAPPGLLGPGRSGGGRGGPVDRFFVFGQVDSRRSRIPGLESRV